MRLAFSGAGGDDAFKRPVELAFSSDERLYVSDPPRDVVSAFGDRPGLFQYGRLDLWEANRLALVEAGVPAEQIEVAGVCTQCQSDQFFSHRANQGQPAGRFAALIRLAC